MQLVAAILHSTNLEHFHCPRMFFWTIAGPPSYGTRVHLFQELSQLLPAWMVAAEYDCSIYITSRHLAGKWGASLLSCRDTGTHSLGDSSIRTRSKTKTQRMPSFFHRLGGKWQWWLGVRLALPPLCYPCGEESGPDSGSWAACFRKWSCVLCLALGFNQNAGIIGENSYLLSFYAVNSVILTL